MTPEKTENALDFLPEAMVDEMLKKHLDVVNNLGNQLRAVGRSKQAVREKLEQLGLIRNVNEILGQRSYTTTVGIDGSYVVIKQLSLDTVAVAAVAVEGLVPPRETRYWEKPQHVVNIFPVPHNSENSRICRGIMFSYELELAKKAPHRVVFLDGSLTSQLIGIGQSLSAISETADARTKEGELATHFKERLESTFKNYLEILESPHVDQLFVGVPKYSSRNEVIRKLQENGLDHPILSRLNDKGLLSTVLKAGEVVGPVSLTEPGQERWHISDVPKDQIPLRDKIVSAINNVFVIYFKPSPGHPALRLEISKDAASNDRRMSTLLDALLDQARIPGVIEPYPIHIADMFVKQVSGALAELRNAALSDLGEMVEMSFSDVFLSLHDYRSEGGFE